MRVKICGITNYDDAMVACDAGADALGFNFAEEAKKRNRYVDPETAQSIIERIPPFVDSVAVCVNASVDDMLHYAEFADYVQLHGEEDIHDAMALGRIAIKAFRLRDELSDADIQSFDAASAWLVDAYRPDARGGTGETTDWSRARALTELDKPIILAGGLTPENVADAITQVRPYAVDTAGGVESEPGKKDHERIRSFIENAKRASLS
jgi:phosphoribosylanthranilate isomerase